MNTRLAPRRTARRRYRPWQILVLVIVGLAALSTNLLVGGWLLMLVLGAFGAAFGFWPSVGVWALVSFLLGWLR